MIFCKSSYKTVVEWSLKDINKPLCISTYLIDQVVARTVREMEQRKGEGQFTRDEGIGKGGGAREKKYDLIHLPYNSQPFTSQNCHN